MVHWDFEKDIGTIVYENKSYEAATVVENNLQIWVENRSW